MTDQINLLMPFIRTGQGTVAKIQSLSTQVLIVKLLMIFDV